MCKINESSGKTSSFTPAMLRTGCCPGLLSHGDKNADQVTLRQALCCPAHVLSGIQHNKYRKMTRAHLWSPSFLLIGDKK